MRRKRKEVGGKWKRKRIKELREEELVVSKKAKEENTMTRRGKAVGEG